MVNRGMENFNNYNLNEYLLITSTRLGRFMYSNYVMRIAWFLGFLAILLMVYVPIIVNFWMITHEKTDLLELLVSYQTTVIYTACGLMGWIINLFYWLFLVCIRFYYCRELIVGSPFNFILFMIKMCTVFIVSMVSGYAAGPVLDQSFEKIGLVPPFSWLIGDGQFLTGGYITPQMGGEPSKGLRVLTGTEFPGAFLIKYFQMKTLDMETQLHHEFLEQESKK